MIYKDVPQHRTNIIQLLLNHVSADHHEILLSQDLFENIIFAVCYPAKLSTRLFNVTKTSRAAWIEIFDPTTASRQPFEKFQR